MKKQLFIISIFALALLLSGACGKKSKKEEDKTEYLTYEEICELPVGSFGIACGEVYNNLEQYIDFFKERDYEYAPVIVRVKENKYLETFDFNNIEVLKGDEDVFGAGSSADGKTLIKLADKVKEPVTIILSIYEKSNGTKTVYLSVTGAKEKSK